MAFIPFIPLLISAAMGSARGILQQHENRKEYDRRKKEYEDWWKANEEYRIRRATLIQSLINSDPKLKEASAFLPADFWTNVMTNRPVPNIFGKRPGGLMPWENFGSATKGALGMNIEGGFEAAMKNRQEQNSYPTAEDMYTGAVNDRLKGATQSGSGFDWRPGTVGGDPGFDVNGNPTPVPGVTSQSTSTTSGPSFTSTPSGSAPPVSNPNLITDPTSKPHGLSYSVPSVLSRMGIQIDPRTGLPVNKFGGVEEF